MSDRTASNNGESQGSFDDFCRGYLLGLEENQSNHNQQQDADIDMGDMDPEQAFGDPNDPSLASLLHPSWDTSNPHSLDPSTQEDPLAGLGFDQAGLDPVFPPSLHQPQPGQEVFFAAAENAHAVGSVFEYPGDALAHNLLPEQQQQPVDAWLPPVDLVDPFFQYHAGAQQDPLAASGSGFFPLPEDDFLNAAASSSSVVVDGFSVRDLDHRDESCELALSDAGDVDTDREAAGNEAVPGRRLCRGRGCAPGGAGWPGSSPQPHPWDPARCPPVETFDALWSQGAPR